MSDGEGLNRPLATVSCHCFGLALNSVRSLMLYSVHVGWYAVFASALAMFKFLWHKPSGPPLRQGTSFPTGLMSDVDDLLIAVS